MLLAQTTAAAPAMSLVDWTQFGLGGAVIVMLASYVWYLTKHNREIAAEHNEVVAKIAEDSNASSEKITDRFIELTRESHDKFAKLHEDSIALLRKTRE